MFASHAGDPLSPRSRVAPRRAGRPGPARDAGGRADPAGAPAAGPPLPRRLPAPRDDHHRGGATRPRRDHPGAGPPGRGVDGRELVCRRRPARPGSGGGRRARARSAPGRLRAPPRQRVGRGGRRSPLRGRRRPGAPARPGPPDRGASPDRPGPRAPGGTGGAARGRRGLARGRRPGAVGGGGRVGGRRPGSRAPARPAGRGARQRAPRRGPAHRVLAVAPRRLGRGGRGRGRAESAAPDGAGTDDGSEAA